MNPSCLCSSAALAGNREEEPSPGFSLKKSGFFQNYMENEFWKREDFYSGEGIHFLKSVSYQHWHIFESKGKEMRIYTRLCISKPQRD